MSAAVEADGSTERPGWKVPALLFGALGAWLTLFATGRFGAALSPDAAGYLSVARNLLAGKGLLTYEQVPLVDQPPLYSAVLAAVGWLLRRDPLEVAAGVNALLFAGTIVLLAMVLARLVRWTPVLWIGLAWFTVALPMRAVHWGVLTEPLFIFLFVLFLLILDRYANRASFWRLALLAVVTALATLTRYLGVTLVASGVLLLLLDRREWWLKRVEHALIFGILAAAPLAAWMARNFVLAGTPLGARSGTRFTLGENLALTANTFGRWFLPVEAIRELPGDLARGLAFPVFASGMDSRPEVRTRGWHPLLPCWIVTIVYLAVVIGSASTVAYDQIGDRLLAPLAAPLVALICAGVDGVCAWLQRSGIGWLRWGVAGLLAVLVLLIGGTTWVAASNAAADGAGGYHRTAWMESPTLAAIEAGALSPDLTIYSNAHDALYLLAEIEAQFAPRKRANNAPIDEATESAALAALEGEWPPEGEIWLVWLDRQSREYLFTPEELATIAEVEEVARFEDGAIYRVARR